MRVARKHHQNRTPSGLHGAGGVCYREGPPDADTELTESRVSEGKVRKDGTSKNKSATSFLMVKIGTAGAGSGV